MDKHDILSLFDRELRMEIATPGMVREATDRIVRFSRPKPGMSFIIYSDLNEDNADTVIAQQIADFTERDLRFEWKVFEHDQPADLSARLIAHGFEAEEMESIMVLAIEETPAALLEHVTADIRRLNNPGQLVDVVAVLEAVWGGDFAWVQERLGEQMMMPNFLSVYVGYLDDRPSSVGWTYFPTGHFATLWAGSTLESARGQGFYKSLLAARIQEAKALGKEFVTLDAGPMSRPIVAHFGFQELTKAASHELPQAEEQPATTSE